MDYVDDALWEQLIRRAQSLSRTDRPAVLGIAGTPARANHRSPRHSPRQCPAPPCSPRWTGCSA